MEVHSRPTDRPIDWNRVACITVQATAAALAAAAVITAIAATAMYFNRSGLPVEGAPTQMPNALAMNSPQAMRIQAEATWTQLQNDPESLAKLGEYLSAERDLDLIQNAIWDRDAYWGMTRDEVIVELYTNPYGGPEGLIQEGLVERYADYIMMSQNRLDNLFDTRIDTLQTLYTQLHTKGYSDQVLEAAAQKMLASKPGDHWWHESMEMAQWVSEYEG